MNKTAIKNFAIWARVNLIESAKQRAYELEITDGGQNNPNAEIIAGRPLSRDEQSQRKQLLEQIRIKGFNQVMEEAAYTWFNRFIALRYMEVNGYLPTRIRVFTNEEGEFKPEILKEAMTVELDGLDREKVLDLLDKQDNESLYKMLLIAQCNSLSAGLPYMFEKIANWTELLFPVNLLKADSVIGQMVSSIPEDDWMDAVQIIGWMYQYYNSELKDETFALLKKNVKITKERIPAATQLFTPDWIVRYMVENSLGRIYIQRKLVNSGDWLVADEATKVAMEKQEAEKKGWKYYLPEAEQEPGVREQLIVISNSYTGMKVEDIKVIDPCMGSGHILVYAFDVLMQIYTASGWSERDAAKSILENNLYGLDIDDRAGQLAYFAVMMKARKYNRRILNGEIRPNVMAIQDSSFMTDELIKYVAAGSRDIQSALTEIKKTFTDAKDYGSILNTNPMNWLSIYDRIDEIEASTPEDLFAMQHRDAAIGRLWSLVKQAEIMSSKYTVVITNPPYMGSDNMSSKLDAYCRKAYPNSRYDLYAVMVERCVAFSEKLISMITQHSWMYLQSYSEFRKNILMNDIVNMVHLGARAFEELAGEVVQTTSFVIQKSNNILFGGNYVRLNGIANATEKEEAFFDEKNLFVANKKKFFSIPGFNIGYWASDIMISSFDRCLTVADIAQPRQGLASGNNALYYRLWQEVEFDKIGIGLAHKEAVWSSGKKYVPVNKGGGYCKWYGNNFEVLKFDEENYDALLNSGNHLPSRDKYFLPGVTWGKIASSGFSSRFSDTGFVFTDSGMKIVGDVRKLKYICAFLHSKVAPEFLKIFSETIHFETGSIAKLPILFEESCEQQIIDLVDENIHIAKQDWDSFEGSWDFETHPLCCGERTIKKAFEKWALECKSRRMRTKDNEITINRVFNSIYGLGKELSGEVDDKDITISDADITREVKSFISYAVGCMFGRYSLDVKRLAYAGGDWIGENYLTFIPDADNIIPICDDEYFGDDVVGRFIKFVETVYGTDVLDENLKFISDALGGSGTSRDVIRKYFLSDFYADHLKIYQKRPIYWQFDSGKKNGFKCLIYMHRYQPDTIARIRTDYIHELQSRYRTAITDLEERVEHAAASERVKLSKQLAKIKDQELELRKYEEKVHHLADQMIEIDLDDGVKVNYAKFGDVLAKIK